MYSLIENSIQMKYRAAPCAKAMGKQEMIKNPTKKTQPGHRSPPRLAPPERASNK